MKFNKLGNMITLPAFLLIISACGSGNQPPITEGQPNAILNTPTQPDAAPTVPTSATLPPPVVENESDPTIMPSSDVTTSTAAPTVEPTVDSAEMPATDEPAQSIPANFIGPDFAANVNPLTGEEMADPARLGQRPIIIKISNSSALVRPQSGLSDADLVYEHISEGGITRFSALFYTNDSTLVGPIRSGRLLDLQLPLWYDAAFAYSGASNEIKWMFKFGGFFERVVTQDWGHGGFWRDYNIGNPNKPDWETLYTNTETIREQLAARNENVAPNFEANMVFSQEMPAGGKPVSSLELGYGATNVFWQYNTGSDRYLRWADGSPHTDANNGQQLAFRNVVVLYAEHELTDIVEDSNGSLSIDIKFWGEGPATIFRNGQKFEGVWRREGMNSMLVYLDNAGNPLPLAPGDTWFQVVPLDFTGLTTTP